MSASAAMIVLANGFIIGGTLDGQRKIYNHRFYGTETWTLNYAVEGFNVKTSRSVKIFFALSKETP